MNLAKSWSAYRVVAGLMATLVLSGLLLSASQPTQAALYGGRTPGAVAAFYYPWYDINGNYNVWQARGGEMASQPTPTYHSGDLNTQKRQMQQARDAGIDAFAVTYNAADGDWKNRFYTMLDNAPTGFAVAAHFEVSLMPGGDKNVDGVVRALRDLRNNAVNKPHYFRYQGRPVIYFWWPQGVPGDVLGNWTNIRNQVDPNHETIWSVDTINQNMLNVFDTIHYFSGAKWADNPSGEFNKLKGWSNGWNAANGGARRLSTASVTPGYDDKKVLPPRTPEFRDRAGGNYYRTSWDAAIAAGSDLVTISTWNEWYESSAIEPGTAWGSLYLDISREKINAYKGIAQGFGDASILKVWSRTDLPVARQSTSRSWTWGPEMFDQQREPYAESPGGTRQTFYFDKSRMEINRPGGPLDPNDLFYVTNGLLPIELMSGQLKTGDNQQQAKGPANIPVAGDSQNNPNSPTYAGLGRVSTTSGQNRQGDRTGQTVTDTLSANGTPGNNGGFAGRGVQLVKYIPESGHNIAGPFWDFMQRSGPVWENNGLTNGPVVEWLFAMGYPVSEAYWTRAKVGGVERDVLVQAFERRVLTYTPDNSEAFKVEMGNVGRHYHLWRYGN